RILPDSRVSARRRRTRGRRFGSKVMQRFPRRTTPITGGLSRSALVLGVVALAGCKKEPATQGVDERTLSLSNGAAAPPLKLTDQKLASYIGYQRRMLDVYATRLDAGANADLTPVVEAEEQARRQSGLQRQELSEIEQMVRAVVGQRAYGGAVPGDDSLERMRAVESKLSGQGRQEVAKSIAELERSREELVRLTEERRRFGDANVDLLLAHEAELTRLWKQTMAAFAPRDPKARGRP
ncbi:MAG TPA: hypothetical protein VKE49_06310, partial [Myxococcaceae bacterium]|nr:hypothetical protein [Myxococcaceae bacterium]